ncbi:hypothetical protein L2E82_17792 [Cichorium intybus]|uniref:Uncharacterized protein n=1 Tax=Cichorium intybus TaxID=13427 RepID=A0ACB9F9R7_CICIN|nr:hypothetical protein L2E82_17792 [Cichorium intybus]
MQLLVAKSNHLDELIHPIKNPVLSDDEEDDDGFNGDVYKPNARRQLFVLNSQQYFSLTTRPLQFYEPIIRGMIQYKMGSNYIASNLYRYTKNRCFSTRKKPIKNRLHLLLLPKVFVQARNETQSKQSKKNFPHDRGVVPSDYFSPTIADSSLESRNN